MPDSIPTSDTRAVSISTALDAAGRPVAVLRETEVVMRGRRHTVTVLGEITLPIASAPLFVAILERSFRQPGRVRQPGRQVKRSPKLAFHE